MRIGVILISALAVMLDEDVILPNALYDCSIVLIELSFSVDHVVHELSHVFLVVTKH